MSRASIAPEDVRYLRKILERDGITHSFTETEEGIAVSADMPEDELNIALREIRCEKTSEEAGMPCYSLETLINHEKRERLMKLNGTRSFVILKEEEEIFLNI